MLADPNISGAGVNGGYTEGARVVKNSNTSIVRLTDTIISFNVESYDTDGIHSTVSNTDRLTCKTAGKYFIAASGVFAANNAGTRYIAVWLNTTKFITRSDFLNAGASYGAGSTISCVYDLSVNDYVRMSVFQSSAGNLNLLYVDDWTPWFAMQRVG